MSEPDPLDTAWRIHAAQIDWTGKVDAKASFALTIESGVIVGVVALASDGRRFGELTQTWVAAALYAGLGLMMVAIICAGSVVLPRMRRSDVSNERPANFIYFGHVKDWTPTDLEAALREKDVLPMLSLQIVNMARITWQKHHRVQLSLWIGLAATLALVVAFIGN